jgi:hypothetical protein
MTGCGFDFFFDLSLFLLFEGLGAVSAGSGEDIFFIVKPFLRDNYSPSSFRLFGKSFRNKQTLSGRLNLLPSDIGPGTYQ